MWVSRGITPDLGRFQTRSAVWHDYALYRDDPGAGGRGRVTGGDRATGRADPGPPACP